MKFSARAVTVRILLAVFTLAVVVDTASILLTRYREMNNGWSWDLAYYNQWYHSLVTGLGELTVRPDSSYGREGRSVWISNYLAPIRLLVAPIYALRPGPETLLATASVFFGLTIPAAFLLAKRESGSDLKALAASGLAFLTPFFEPLRNNDFRELQLAIPFMIVAIEGVRSRSRLWMGVGIVGALACRQESAIFVASLLLIPPRASEDRDATLRWSGKLALTGLAWFLVFLAYMRISHGPYIVEAYLHQFGDPGPSLAVRLRTGLEIVVLGLGSWGLLMLVEPRAALVAVPWLWGLVSGRWRMDQLAGPSWHHVRYAAPLTAAAIAVGILGLCRADRACDRLSPRLRKPARALLWGLTALGLWAGRHDAVEKLTRVPRPISKAEAETLRAIIATVEPDAVVMTDYRVSAHLSSRRYLWSDVFNLDAPRFWPEAGPEFGWVFAEQGHIPDGTFERQGFRLVHDGPTIRVHQRAAKPGQPPTMPLSFADVVYPMGWSELVLAIVSEYPIGPPIALLVAGWVGWRIALGRKVGRSDGGESARSLLEQARREGTGLGSRMFPVLVWGIRMISYSGWMIAGFGMALGMLPFVTVGVVTIAVALVAAGVVYPMEAGAARRASVGLSAKASREISVLKINFLLHALFPFADPSQPAR